jgi:WXG100 family type VII secretion target
VWPLSINTNQLRDDGAIREGAQLVASAKEELTGEISRLENEIAGWATAWKGSGAAAFMNFQQNWNTRVTKLYAVLDEFSSNLTGTAAQVEDTEADVSSSWGEMQGLLGG